MESPELERRSVDPSNPKKGPNPNRDYKQHFIRQKQRYDAASTDHVNRTRELNRASLKQMKLQDEIEFLLDAIAGEKRRQKATPKRSSISVGKNSDAFTTLEATETEENKPSVNAGQVPDETEQSTMQQVDDELDDLMQEEDSIETSARRSGRRSSGRISNTSGPVPATNLESASANGSVKRRRASYSDTDDELLESAGLSSTKRARNE